MRKLVVITALLIAGLCAPRGAQAKSVEEVRIAADAADMVITVLSDVPLRTPTIRTYAGLVRVRFYDVMQPQSVRVAGDGGALRAAELGRGSDQTAALTLVLGDQTKLAPADVRVEIAGTTTTLRLARGLLPPIREGAIATQPARPEPPPAQPIATIQPTAPAAAQPASAAQPAAAEPKAAAPVAEPTSEPTPTPAPAPTPTLGKPKPTSKPDGKLTGSPESSSTIPLLIGISALLALAYGGLQLFMRRQGTKLDVPSIDVVAQKRLGPRHQLVIVRAFDRDYLLSIQGNQTTVVARSSRKRLSEAEALLTPAVARKRTEPLSSRDFEEDDEVTFGGELFKQALEQRERAREASAAYRVDRAPKEPAREPRETARQRTELDRLQVDGNAVSEDGRILGNDPKVGRTSRMPGESERRLTLEERLAAEEARSEALEESEDAEAMRTPDGMSESVSGLLRLRKQAGR